MPLSFSNRRLAKHLVCLLPLGLTVSGLAGDMVPPVSERFAGANAAESPDFQRHIVPMLGKLGCSAAKCHGSFQGKGDFRLSLFGFDFESDQAALTAEASSEDGRRINAKSPAESLIILKPTRQIKHRGKKIFDKDSWPRHLLQRWVESGAKGTETKRRLAKLDYEPKEILFRASGDTAQIRVIAEWADGAREDVTCLARFRTNNDSVVEVSNAGLATSTGKGDTHIVALYDNGVAAIPVLRPVSDELPKIDLAATANPIDRFVVTKLAKLGITPSAQSSDTEFLRRVSIDMTGTLPAPAEVEAFIADTTADKRPRKIDELLGRPTHAGWWANKLCDFTGCNPGGQTDVTEVAQEKSVQWYDWIFHRIEQNMPYDKIVEGIFLAEGRSSENSRSNWSEEMSAYVRRGSKVKFSARATMPHYWTRNSVNEKGMAPRQKALAVAHSFLGIQLQCAQCHKHPFDQWTQHDFNDFARFFERVQVSGGRVGFPQFNAMRQGAVGAWPQLVVRDADEATELDLLRSGRVEIGGSDDPRKPIMAWLRDPDNPWFARSFVNRVWAGYFNVGIVEPTDEFTPANPPSNPELLDWLTDGFIKNGYDMKWLHRQIASSETYQRSWRPNETNRNDRRNFSRAIPRRIPAEVVYDAAKQVTAKTDRIAAMQTNLRRRAAGHLSMRMAGTHAMKVFGKPDRALNCDCERVNEPTLLQAIFLQNDPLIRMRLKESGWIAEIAESQSRDEAKLIRAAWLRVLNRPPSRAEVARAKEHLAKAESPEEGMTDLLWALMNTKEFILNH